MDYFTPVRNKMCPPWACILMLIYIFLGAALSNNYVDDVSSKDVSPPHPLDPLTAEEMQKTTEIINSNYPNSEGWMYSVIYLQEPPKSLLQNSFLKNEKPPKVLRQAFAAILHKTNRKVYEVIVNLDSGTIDNFKELPDEVAPLITTLEYTLASEALRKNPEFISKCKSLGFHNISNIFFRQWNTAHDHDDKNPSWKGKWIMYFVGFERQFDMDNDMGHPLPFSVIVDLNTNTVLKFEDFPVSEVFDIDLKNFTAVMTSSNYDQSLKNLILREGVKLSETTYPDGVNYKVKEHQLQWQNWQMQIGFNVREGLIVHHVGYYDMGTFRPLFYRLSISELWVPYGDPRPPFYRKAVFDETSFGLGHCAIPLYAPANCKGSVHFFDGVINGADGKPIVTKNAICIYEEDNGILWTHKDHNSGDNNVVRSQRLALSFQARVGHYDYIFYWYFYQDASVEFKVLLTGLVSSIPLNEGSKSPPYGTIVSERIVSLLHQHFFNVRIDADIDGTENGVSTVDVISVEEPSGSKENYFGNGMVYKNTELKTAGEGRSNSSPEKSRVWKIQNENTKNNISGNPVSYILKTGVWPTCLVKLDSPVREKGNFTTFTTWVTPYKDDEVFAVGKYLTGKDGLTQRVERDVNVNIWNTDLVLWHTVGVTHLPRVEDWPVMPAETTGFFLKPVGFFERNPALDVPRVPTEEDYGPTTN